MGINMYVYAIELKPEVLNQPKFKNQNPDFQGKGRCVFLSTSSIDPNVRFEEIKSGKKNLKIPAMYGTHLLPDLTDEYNRKKMDGYEAVECIFFLAAELRKKGNAAFIPDGLLEKYKVYVIKLNKAVLSEYKFRSENPNYKDGMPCVYVGMTKKSPEERFRDHKNHNNDGQFVPEYGEKLLKSIYEKYNEKPMYSWEASRLEKSLAKELRNQGYAVWQK